MDGIGGKYRRSQSLSRDVYTCNLDPMIIMHMYDYHGIITVYQTQTMMHCVHLGRWKISGLAAGQDPAQTLSGEGSSMVRSSCFHVAGRE